MNTEKTPEEIAAEKEASKQVKAAEKAQKLATAKAEKSAKAEAAKKAKAEAKAENDAKKQKDLADKKAAKEAALAAKEANKMPEQNGIRHPKPDTLCGKAWAIFDKLSQKNGAPCSIKEALEVSNSQGLSEGNVKAEYARWRKYYGVTGRISAPSKEAA